MTIQDKILASIKQNFIVILVLLALVLMSLLGVYKQIFGLSESESVSLSILLITATLWVSEAIPLFVASLGVLLLSLVWLLPTLNIDGIVATKQDFYLSFFSDITMLFMGGFVLSLLLNKYRLARRMADQIITKTGNNPAKLLLSIIMISAFLSMWMSNTATAAMMLAIVGPLIYQLPDGAPFAKALALAIPFACNLGGLGTPIGTPPNAIALQYLQGHGMPVSFIEWMMVCVPIMLILLYFLWQLLLKAYSAEGVEFKMEITKKKKINGAQYIVIVVFVLTVLGWMTTGLTGLTTGLVGLMVVVVSFSTGLLAVRDFRNLSWDILFMIGGGLCLGVGLKMSGLTEHIAGSIGFGDSFWMLFGIMILLAALMTTFMSNTATANLLIPVAVSMGQNEILVVIAIAIMCSSAMALPVSTPPNAIAFGSGLLKAKDMIRNGLALTIVALVITFIFAYFYIPLIV